MHEEIVSKLIEATNNSNLKWIYIDNHYESTFVTKKGIVVDIKIESLPVGYKFTIINNPNEVYAATITEKDKSYNDFNTLYLTVAKFAANSSSDIIEDLLDSL